MKKIVAIGGGENGRTKILEDGSVKVYPVETLEIDKKIIELANKKNPKLLFLGTAKEDKKSYFNHINYYFTNLGCEVSALKLVNEKPSEDLIRSQILSADIIYVGGGDTRRMLEIWKSLGVDRLLKEAYEQGVVLSGVSAGANCWFEYYDNDDYCDEENWSFGLLSGLGFVSGFAVPHYDTLSNEMKTDINKLLKEKNINGVAMDNCSACVVIDDEVSFISSEEGKNSFYLGE